MATKQTSAQKRHRQSEARRMRNRAVKSQVHTSLRKYLDAIRKKDHSCAQEMLRAFQSEIDNAKRKGVVKQNSASRKKSRMFRLFNKTFSEAK